MVNIPILKTTKELELWHQEQKAEIYFVPTMGALHEGHSKLIQSANAIKKDRPGVILVSIFINPLQFGLNEDFEKYPRALDQDASLAYAAGANAIWAPDYEDVFPGGAKSHFQIKVPETLQSQLCGASRKGHFDGVATVIIRLLQFTRPKIIFLGEKDWQQLVIIRQLINDLGITTKVQGVPTARDQNGLAFSSRNSYLKQNDVCKAISLPKTLLQAAKDFKRQKSINVRNIESSLEKNGLEVEYVETVDPKFLTSINHAKNLSLLAAAVRCGETRLIDHVFLMSRNPIVAIDGPAGAGKSTVTRAFAKKLGLLYLDTGAMYRAVTWLIIKKGIDLKDDEGLSQSLKELNLEFKVSQLEEQNVFLNGKNITKEIRSPEITEKVPLVASKSIVREILTIQQKELGKDGGLVAEGRDIGTTVFPDAELKVFLTASPKERAKRRSIDLKNKGFTVPNLLDLEKQIKERDQIDSSRKIAPLLKSEEAIELVTDGMSIEEVIDSLIKMFRLEIPEEVWPTPIL